MSLVLNIQRIEGTDTQVKCSINGNQINEFYSFGLKEDLTDYTDTEIDTYIRANLTGKGYTFV